MSNYTIFKVIKIIDEYSIVINGGLNNDITIGDEIEVYLEGDDIIDPFNENEILGTLDFIKEKLEVTEIYSNFSVCKKIVKEEVFQPSAFQKAISRTLESYNSIGGTTVTTFKEKKINVDEKETTGRKTGDKIIRIGDIARIAVSE